MKKLKKIFVGVLTLTLSFLMTNVVLAETTKGSITIEKTTPGKTYEVYKIFDLTYSGNNVAYTIDTDWYDFFKTGGIGQDYIVTTNTTGNLNSITVTDEDGNKTTKYINITNDNIVTFTQDALTYASKVSADASQIAQEDSTTVTFSDLELGYYLVYPKGATDKLNTYGTIASIDSTLPDATVEVKATYPTIEKKADDQFVDVGQIVTFTITGKIPDTTGYTKYIYEVTDEMTEGLKFDLATSEFTIKIGEITINQENYDYTLVQPENTNGFKLTFDMTNYQMYVDQTITITYKATTTEAAVANNDVHNKATLTYSNNPKDLEETETTPENEVPVYSSAIQLIKVDKSSLNNGEYTIKLAGAEFILSKTIKDETTGKDITVYYQAIDAEGNPITRTATTEGVVKVNWVSDESEATILVTEEDGIAIFKGIENGVYQLIEIKAPEGYNKLTKPVEIKVGYNEEGTNIEQLSITESTTIENSTGTELPSTGGIGTKLFIVIGGLLTIVSTIVFVTNKRMSKEFK